MPEACNFIKKETLAQSFSCKFCEIFKNIFFAEHLRATTSKDTFEKIWKTLSDTYVRATSPEIGFLED